MSDTPTNNLNDETLDEELVAYLDGELQPESAKRIEGLLAADGKVRDRLGELAASWDLLDQLPRATVDDLFTRTTVEMVAVAAEGEIAAATAPAKRRMQWIGGGVAAVLAAMVGFAAAALALPSQNNALLNDLPVVADLELYRAANNINMLRQFQKEGLFTEDIGLPSFISTGASEKLAGTWSGALPPIPDSIEDRRTWIEALPSLNKTELRRNFEWFAAHPAEQQDLRQFDKELRADKQVDELRKTMQRYHDWLITLAPIDRAELAEKSFDNRVAAIKQRQQEQGTRAFSMFAGGGSNRRQDSAFTAMRLAQQHILAHEKDILTQLTEAEKAELEERKQKDDRDEGRRRQYPSLLAWYAWRPNSPVTVPRITDDELKSFVKTLTPEQAERIKSLEDAPDRMSELRKLVHASIVNRFSGGWGRGPGGPIPEDMLAGMLRQMTPEQRKQIEGLTGQERDRKVWEIFNQNRRPQDRGPGMGPMRPGEEGPGGRRKGGPRGEGGRRDEFAPTETSPKEQPQPESSPAKES
jgi:hypothetical protein